MKKTTTKLWLALAAMTICATACAKTKPYPKAPEYVGHPKGEFPIVATYAFWGPYMTDLQLEWVKEAGFNTITKALDYDQTDKLLRMAARHDIDVIVSTAYIRDNVHTRDALERYASNPTVWGFSLYDEPKASKFGTMKELQDKTNRYAPGKLGFINLLPAVWPQELDAKNYDTYVEDYVRKVNPSFISFDIYPVRKNKNGEIFVAPATYESYETISRVARESERPFWAYVGSNEHGSYPAPKEEYIRFQVFTALAYGAQGILYYTYCVPDFKSEGEYLNTPIDKDGRKTETWHMVSTVNHELKNLEKVFLGAEVVSVTQTGRRIPEKTKRNYTVPAPFRGIESQGEGVTVSHLRNGDAEYLLLVNRDVLKSQKVRLGSDAREVTRLYGDGSARAEIPGTITLSPGGYALYRL